MKNQECLNCIEYKSCRDSFTSWLFFIIGLIATISIRAVTVLVHVNPVYGKIAWYIGVGGFFIFFIYKYKINQRRAKLINQRNLIDKFNQQENLSKEDYSLISAILCSITLKKERINYIFIFGLSALAILVALYIDFFLIPS